MRPAGPYASYFAELSLGSADALRCARPTLCQKAISAFSQEPVTAGRATLKRYGAGRLQRPHVHKLFFSPVDARACGMYTLSYLGCDFE